MKIFKISVKVLMVLAVTTSVSHSQIYFEDNFDNPKESEKKWHVLYGDWQFKNKEYHQLMLEPNCMSVVSDEYWDEKWDNYTYEVKGNAIEGAEGFLIMFRCRGLMQARGKALKKPPARMKNQKSSLEYWWNLGGWGNTHSKVESWGGIGGADSGDTIKYGDSYDIKIINTPKSYTVILNDKEVASVEDTSQDGVGRVGLATWSTAAKYDEVIVYGPDGPKLVSSREKVSTTWADIKSKLEQ